MKNISTTFNMRMPRWLLDQLDSIAKIKSQEREEYVSMADIVREAVIKEYKLNELRYETYTSTKNGKEIFNFAIRSIPGQGIDQPNEFTRLIS